MLQIGQIAPDFSQNSTEGLIRFHKWLGSSWVLLFSHPKSFTPICTTEIGEVSRLKPEWEARDVKVLGLSVDSLDTHNDWAPDIEETQGHALNFPLIADSDCRVAPLYGMIHPESDPSQTVRAVFVIDPDKKVRLTLSYPPSVGRNFTEILRIIDSLQLTDARKVSTPVNWMPGDRVIIPPTVSDADAVVQFPQGFDRRKPYLRYVQL